MAVESRGAQKALMLAERPESFLSAVQLWITLLSLLIGYFGGESMGDKIAVLLAHTRWLAPYAGRIGFVAGFLLTLFSLGLFGELVPKRIATLRPEPIACAVAYPMDFFATLAKPFVATLSFATRTVMRLIGLHNAGTSQVTEEEIRLLVSESHEQGVIDDDERNMVNRVLRLGDRTADSLMTPRTKVVWLDAAATLTENLQTLREARYSRYPVYRHNDQDVVGVLEVKTLLDNLAEAEPDLFGELREALFVSESTHAMKLLEIFREEQQSLALVVDEYGEIQGLVTISDLMGAVVGRLQAAENTDDAPLVTTRNDGSLLVDGSLPNDDLRELLGGVALPGDENDYNTVAGMVIERFGRIPQTGEYFDWSGWRIEIVDLDGARIDKLLLQKLPEVDDGDDG
jgi:putative hemolysin